MTLYLDTSVLITAVVDGPRRQRALELMCADLLWCSSALTLAEAIALIPSLTDLEVIQRDIEDEVRLLWDRFAVVPVDQMCLDRAAQITATCRIRVSEAIHFAAAERVEALTAFVTFSFDQIVVASNLGFDVRTA